MKKAQRVRKYLAVLLCAALMLTSIPVTALAEILDESDGWKVKELTITPEDKDGTTIKVGETKVFTVTPTLTKASPSEATPSVAKASAADAIMADFGDGDVKYEGTGKVTISYSTTIVMDGNGSPDCGDNQFTVTGVEAGSGKLVVTTNGETKAELGITICELEALTFDPSPVEIKNGESRVVAIKLEVQPDVAPEDKEQVWNEFWVNGAWKISDEETKSPLAEDISNGVASWTWKAGKGDDPENFTGYIRIDGKGEGETTLHIECDGKGAPLPIVVTPSEEPPEEPLVSEIKIDPSEATIDMNSEDPTATITVTPTFVKKAETDREKREQLMDFRDKYLSFESIELDRNIAEITGKPLDPAAGAVKLIVTGRMGGETTLTVSDKSNGFAAKSCKITVISPEETVIAPAPGDTKVAPAVSDKLDILAGDEESLIDAASEIGDALAENPIIDNLDAGLENYLKEQVEGKDIDTVKITPKVTIDNLEASVTEDKKLVVTKIDLDMDIKVDVYGQKAPKELGEELRKDILDKGYSIPMTVSLPGAEARGGNNRAEWTHYSDNNRTSTDNSVFVGGRTTTIYDDEDAASSFTTVTVKSFSPFSIVFKMDNGGGGSSSGGSSSSGSSGSSSVGTTTVDSHKGHVNSVTGIVTGSGAGYSSWVAEAPAAGQTESRWKLQYADGTFAAGTYVTDAQGQIVKDAAGNPVEQPAWELINGAWYAFGVDSYAKSGMIFDPFYNGWFYIDINTGMKTGWQQINGVWYYFNPVSDGKKGIMYVDTVTPDGYHVNADGSWDGQPKAQ